MKKIVLAFALIIAAFGTGYSKDKKPKLEKGLYAEIETNRGKILLQLEMEKTPLTVANFVGLSEGKIKNKAKADGAPFYDGLKFHRVIANFMIQGGDPQGTGAGNPGYSFKDEFRDDLQFTCPGILAMANSGPATNGSQFFITHTATTWLNGHHTIFGHVITGQEIVNATVQGDTIVHIKIIRKGKKARKFKAAKVFEELKGK
jgi:peptidyl-prolyl cis-trans isomerase A (cyclophilin A)